MDALSASQGPARATKHLGVTDVIPLQPGHTAIPGATYVPFARCVLHDEVGSLARTNLGFRFVLLPLELAELVRELPAVDDLREWTEANPRPMGGERHPEVIA